MEGGREQNYWPGFVDALSNVVLTLVFVIVVFVFALALGSQQASAPPTPPTPDTQTQTPPENTEKLAGENQELRQQLIQAQADIQKLQTQAGTTTTATPAQVDTVNIDAVAKPDPTQAQKAFGVQATGDKIIVTYPPAVSDLDDKSTASLAKVLDDFKHRLGKRKITIHSIGGDEPFSASQRNAYYRAVSVRNLLISKGVAESGDISSLVDRTPTTGGGRVEIDF